MISRWLVTDQQKATYRKHLGVEDAIYMGGPPPKSLVVFTGHALPGEKSLP